MSERGIQTLVGHLRALEGLAKRQLEPPVSPSGARARIAARVEECKRDIEEEQCRLSSYGSH